MEKKLVVISGEREGGSNIRVRLLGVRQATRMYCTTWGIQLIFCNNCKWSITIKMCIKIKKQIRIRKVQLNLVSFGKYNCICLKCKKKKWVTMQHIQQQESEAPMTLRCSLCPQIISRLRHTCSSKCREVVISIHPLYIASHRASQE